MASLIEDYRKRSPYWICCYTRADGKQLKKSTKISIKPLPGELKRDGTPKTKADKKTEAWEFCLAIERAENSAKAATLTEQAAKKLINEIMERTTGEKLQDFTAEAWFNEWRANKTKISPASAERYEQVAREFLASLGDRAKLSIAHITPKDIRAY